MNKHRASMVIILVILLALANLKSSSLQAQIAMSTFFQRDYVGLSIRVDASQEVVPEENIAVMLSVNCTATGVRVENFNIVIYGFRNGREKILLNAFEVMHDIWCTFNSTYESSYSVFVPNDVWGPIYAELNFRYNIFSTVFADDPSFAMTTVRNVNYERLQEEFNALNASYIQLNATYWALKDLYAQLNASYAELNALFTAKSANYEQLLANYNKLSESYNQLDHSYGELEDLYTQLNALYNELNHNHTGLAHNYTELNQYYTQLVQNYTILNQDYTKLNSTYAELGQNCTALQESLNEVSGTRQVAVILGVMTTLLVGTSVYLLKRKPKLNWW